MKTKRIVIISLLCIAAGFFLGRSTVKTEERVEYIKEKPVKGSVNIPPPVKEIKPYKPLLPLTYIFLKDTVIEKVDTAKIIEEYITEKHYNLTLFDKDFGKLDLKPTLQYNKLTNIDYTYTPITKTVTNYREQVFIPFASASYNTFGTAGVGGGFFYKKIGAEYNYLYSTFSQNSGHQLSVKVRF